MKKISLETNVAYSVLNPADSDAQLGPSTSRGPPAFTSSNMAPNSSMPRPTGTGSAGSGGMTTIPSGAAAAPMRTAAVGAAALFGGMAVYVNI